MKIFWTDRAYRRHVAALIKEAQIDPAHILLLYSENPALLRAATAAYNNLPETSFRSLNVTSAELMYRPMKRALREFATALHRLRTEKVVNATT